MSEKPARLHLETPLETPSHGHGKLKRGGKNPNGGRPKEELRARMRESLHQRLHIAEQIADDPKVTAETRLKALEFLSRYGLGTSDEREIKKSDSPVAMAGKRTA